MPVQANLNKCISCGGCVSVCPVNAIELKEKEITIDAEKCIDCKTCTELCPVSALKDKEQEKGTIYPIDEEED